MDGHDPKCANLRALPWQVSGRSDLSQEQSEYLDVSYIENWSIAGDLAILAKTVMVIFTGRGSY